MSYYQTLKVSETATQEEIKNSYRSLVKQFHPDKNPDDPSAKESFQKVQEAYETLGDQGKRNQYDNSRKFSGNQFNFEDLFKGGSWSSDFDRHFNANAKGPDVRVNANFSVQESYYGTSKTFELGYDSVKVDFNRGIHNGMILKVYGRGEYNRFNTSAQRGDLIINISINPDDSVILNGSDIWTDVYIPFYDLILGANTDVETPFGKYKINIPAKTPSERVLRIPGKGMPIWGTNNYGNLMVKVHANFNCSEEQLELINMIKKLE